MILGLPWLRKYNPTIDWAKGTLCINRVSMATKLAQQQTPKPSKTTAELVPPQYHAYLDRFDKKSAERFPPSRPYDHEIKLKDGFEPKVFKTYPISPREEEEFNSFIEENLRLGRIRPSQSPMGSPFFFVKKKNGKLRPCQDYRHLNE